MPDYVPINQLANLQLEDMVYKGHFIGLIQGHLTQNTVWTKSKTNRPAKTHDGQEFRVNESEPGKAKESPSENVAVDTTNPLELMVGKAPASFQKQGHYFGVCEKYDDWTRVSYDDLHQQFADTVDSNTQWLGEGAALTRDKQARRRLNWAYNGTRTYARTASATPTTTIAVKDVSGFRKVWVRGMEREVSASNPLTITITNDTVGTVQRDVIGVTPGVLDPDSDIIPGTLTLATSIAEIDVGDPVISSQESATLRPNGRTTDYNLLNTDVLTLKMCWAMTTIMMSHGIKPCRENGKFNFIGHVDHFYQLWEDPQFAAAYRGRYDSDEFKRGQAIEVGNILFDFTHQPAEYVTENNVRVKRGLILGDGALDDFYFESDPKQVYNSNTPEHSFTYDPQTRSHFIVQKNIGRTADFMHMSWLGYWGFAARRDSLAKFGFKPNAPGKRCIGVTTG